MESLSPPELVELVNSFTIHGDFESISAHGNGHINQTLVSVWNQGGTRVRYLHQQINSQIFVRPDEVMENIERVSLHIKSKLPGVKDKSRRTLTVVPARSGKLFARDKKQGWWRTYLFIEGAHSLETAANPGEVYLLGASVGRFQNQLADLGGERLHESIPGFHNMERRYKKFYTALALDPFKRVAEAAAEIAFMRENEKRGLALMEAVWEGTIPERISHNDTKINNILIDNEDNSALCLVDLDTVMPGSSLFDVGDLIRTAACRAEEDETDFSRVIFDPVFYRALLEGYLSEAGEFLTGAEKKLLAESGRSFAQIMGLRFLTDYLEGDRYYQIARPLHNLDRCRNQIALIKSMDAQWDTALGIAAELS
jgi:Ser/Thr protein kinase RdoA (MazF antagonist)